MSVSNSDTQFTARDGKHFDVHLSMPQGSEPLTAVLFMPAIFGVDECMKGLMQNYAENGFLVAAPDYFFRTVPGPVSDLDAAFARMNTHDIDQGVADMEDTISQLKAHPRSNGKVVVLGFCFGGLFAYLSAVRLSVDAIGTFHGTRIHDYIDEIDKLSVPASLHYGADDPFIPLEEVEIIQKATVDNPLCDVVVHPGGQHNFSMPDKPGYDASIAGAAEQAVLKIFKAV